MKLRTWFLLPARAWMLLFFALPMGVVAAYSLLARGDYGGVELPFSFASFARFADPLYAAILGRSFVMAAVATAVCAALGFPLAVFISGAGARKNLYLQLVILPFWTSFLVRTYAWLFLLRDTGLVNSLLEKAGLIHHPLPLLYNDGAVLLGLVYGYLPFMVLPVFAILEKLDPALPEAAADLGASPYRALLRVTLPLAKPGLIAGSVLVFVPCLGAYLTPDLMGGGKSVMIGNLIQNQFTTARDWPFGAAASLVLMAVAAALLLAFRRQL